MALGVGVEVSKEHAKVSLSLSLLGSTLRITCKLSGTAPAPSLPVVTLHTIIVIDLHSISVIKCLIKCFLLSCFGHPPSSQQ